MPVFGLNGSWVVGGDNNIMTQIGLIVLVGLACKNAILIVEFAREAELQEGMTLRCRPRCRPHPLAPDFNDSISFILGFIGNQRRRAELRQEPASPYFPAWLA